ncbi:hypothetical protein [Glutamicibacter sp. Je.9.36]|uniref:hypothetical protein n=1 Tax=Glutamicibacter sp. Je.9.36 TaxID=3142837 RepID=UPI003DAA38A8
MGLDKRGIYVCAFALVLIISGVFMITLMQAGILGWALQAAGIFVMAISVGAARTPRARA